MLTLVKSVLPIWSQKTLETRIVTGFSGGGVKRLLDDKANILEQISCRRPCKPISTKPNKVSALRP